MEEEYNLFLDDYRIPLNCVGYVHTFGIRPDIYTKNEWVVVKNYPEFIRHIQYKGLPKTISFDHDLADGHYHQNMLNGQLNYDSEDFNSDDYNKTGYHCAKWLIEYCIDTGLELPMFYVHSMNPVGKENIESLLNNFKNKYGK